MKKKKLFMIIVLFLSIITACTNDDKNKENVDLDDINQENKINSIEEFENEIKVLKLNYDKVQMVAGFVGAKEGIKLYIGNSKLEIYKFDKQSSDYQKAYNNQKIIVNGKNEYSAIVKNGYALLIDEDFPEYDKIISIFERLN